MTFRRAFLITYATMLAIFVFILLMNCVLPGREPRHPEVAIMIGTLGLPTCAAFMAWAETRKKRSR